MLPVVNELFCLCVVLFHNLLQHPDRHIMLLGQTKTLNNKACGRSVYNEGHQDDTRRKEHDLVL